MINRFSLCRNFQESSKKDFISDKITRDEDDN